MRFSPRLKGALSAVLLLPASLCAQTMFYVKSTSKEFSFPLLDCSNAVLADFDGQD